MTGNTLEQRARELLAAEHRKCDRHAEADLIEAGNVTALGRMSLNAIESALRLSAGADWQPIETAPKDGTRILLFGRHSNLSFSGGWDQYENTWSIYGIGPVPEANITHWQPLPAAPRHEPGEG